MTYKNNCQESQRNPCQPHTLMRISVEVTMKIDRRHYFQSINSYIFNIIILYLKLVLFTDFINLVFAKKKNYNHLIVFTLNKWIVLVITVKPELSCNYLFWESSLPKCSLILSLLTIKTIRTRHFIKISFNWTEVWEAWNHT